jgi:PiT family inorganic phosphate transporter
MLTWALWLSVWLSVFWARLIKTVWNEITKLDQIRAFCVALAAASTVIVASWLGLPVSSTQIALWAVFWIWLFRQYLQTKKWSKKIVIEKSMIKWIILSWIVTLPIAWLIASWTYLIIMFLTK